MKKRKILYIDMDGVLVDFDAKARKADDELLKKYNNDFCNIPGVFLKMEPMPGALDAFRKLFEKFDTYILSTAPWENSSVWSDKLEWVKKNLGDLAYKRLIITNHKELNKGDYLIDDMHRNGADGFEGELILFGSDRFPDWEAILKYLLP